MTVTIKLYGVLRRYRPEEFPGSAHSPFKLKTVDTVSIQQLTQLLDIDAGMIAGAAINGETVQLDTMVHDGDEIAFFPPVAGG